MNYETQIALLTEMLKTQQKLHETAVDMLKPAVDAAYKKGYADAMGWKTQNHLEHLPTREWQGLTDEEIMDACSAVWASHPIEVGRVVEAKLKEKNA